jgi:hypothetical protein
MQLWLLKLALFTRTRISFSDAIGCFRKEMGLDKNEERVSVLTVVPFVLGPLPRFVKLNACSGIPWTLTWSWIYIFCYVQTAITNMSSGGADVSPGGKIKPILKRVSTWLYVIAHITQTVLSIWLVKTALYTYSVLNIVGSIFSVLTCTCLILCFLTVIPGGCFHPLFTIFRASRNGHCDHREGTPWDIFPVFLGIVITYFLIRIVPMMDLSDIRDILLGMRPDPFTPFSIALWFISLIIWPLLGLALLSALSQRFGPSLDISSRRLSIIEPTLEEINPLERPEAAHPSKEAFFAALQLGFAFTILLLTLAYYWQFYDAEDTMKPSWVDVFG